IGGLGNDRLTGGAGADIFVFNTRLTTNNIDRINDFSVVDDTILLENAIFTTLSAGTLAASAFASNMTGKATDALDRLIYEKDSGALWYDADGTGSGARIQFATISAGLSLTAVDFLVI
ncbi:calcium-binding protein, partial [Rhodobacter sp. NSM]